MEINDKEFLFVEKYRPKSIKDCILPEDIEKTFNKFVEIGNVNNLLLSGSAGSGKTTTARALCEDLGCDYFLINASEERGIDVLRSKITDFVTTVSLHSDGRRKIVILDEADNMTPDMQSALRGFIEKYSANAGFILTCNHQNKIIDPLHSRLVHVPFSIHKDDKKLMARYMMRLKEILVLEEIKFDPKAVVLLIQKSFPDFRKVLNEVQRYGSQGKIDTGIFANIQNVQMDDIFDFLKQKDFRSMREYFDVNSDVIDLQGFFHDMYNSLDKHIVPSFIPPTILLIAEYEYKSYFMLNQKINLVAMLTHIMSEIEFNG